MENMQTTTLLERALAHKPQHGRFLPHAAVNTAQEQRESTVPESLKPYTFQPGKSGNPAGRPKGSKNIATQMRELMAGKTYTLKDEVTGQTIRIDAMTALLEKALENAIQKGDRESIRMIWEFLDGKPTQQHRLETNGARGYEVSPEQEAMILAQFDIYDGDLTPPTKAS
jgi:hypothetical protein